MLFYLLLAVGRIFLPGLSGIGEQQPYLICWGRYYPCQYCCICGGKKCPPPWATFIFDSGNGCYAGEIYQHEEQIAECDERGDSVCCHLAVKFGIFGACVFADIVNHIVVSTVKHSERGGNDFFCAYACNQPDIKPPVKSLGTEDGFDGLSDTSYIALFLLLLFIKVVVMWKIL